MDTRQTARLDAAKRVQAFNNNPTNAAQLATIKEYAAEETDLNTTIQQIDDAIAIQAQDNTGIASGKEALLITMANTIVKYAQRGVVLANRAANTPLEQGLNHPASYYLQETADICLSRATATKNLINSNLTVLTNVTAANVAEMETAITNFAAVKDEPTIAHQTQKVEGTDQIDPLLDNADLDIEHMGYLIHSYFPNTILSETFDLTSKLNLLGIRHTGVSIQFEDSQTVAPITNGTATKANTGKTATTDNTGVAAFATSHFGKQTFNVTAPGYQPQSITIQVNRGTLTEVVVKMVKA